MGSPFEVFKFNEVAKDEFFAFLQQVWDEEKLPQPEPLTSQICDTLQEQRVPQGPRQIQVHWFIETFL